MCLSVRGTKTKFFEFSSQNLEWWRQKFKLDRHGDGIYAHAQKRIFAVVLFCAEPEARLRRDAGAGRRTCIMSQWSRDVPPWQVAALAAAALTNDRASESAWLAVVLRKFSFLSILSFSCLLGRAVWSERVVTMFSLDSSTLYLAS